MKSLNILEKSSKSSKMTKNRQKTENCTKRVFGCIMYRNAVFDQLLTANIEH
jgi:hypothetical protein